MVPETVRVWPEDTVAPAAGLVNVIEPEDVEVWVVAVDEVVVLAVVEEAVVLLAADDDTVVELILVVVDKAAVLLAADDGMVVELILASIEKTSMLKPTSNSTAIRTTLLAFNPRVVPVAREFPARLIVKVSPDFVRSGSHWSPACNLGMTLKRICD
jgi:hypothetical protein